MIDLSPHPLPPPPPKKIIIENKNNDCGWCSMRLSKFCNLDNLLLHPLIHNVPEWADTFQKSCSICCKVFKVCLAILGRYALKGCF